MSSLSMASHSDLIMIACTFPTMGFWQAQVWWLTPPTTPPTWRWCKWWTQPAFLTCGSLLSASLCIPHFGSKMLFVPCDGNARMQLLVLYVCLRDKLTILPPVRALPSHSIAGGQLEVYLLKSRCIFVSSSQGFGS